LKTKANGFATASLGPLPAMLHVFSK